MFFLYFLLVFVLFVYLYLTRTFNYWKKRYIVGPKPLPLFGNLKDSTLRKETLCDSFKTIYDKFPDEKVVGIFRMTSPCLLVRDLDIIKQILIKDFDLFEDRGIEFSDDGLGTNMFHADGETWRVLRNKFTPLFTTMKLKNMLHLILDRGDYFVKHLNNITANGTEQEIHSLCQKFTISTIATCAFGIDIDTYINSKLINTINEMDDLIFKRNYLYELDFMYPGLLKKVNMSLFPIGIRYFFQDLISKVMKERQNNPTTRNDFIDLILELKRQEILSIRSKNGEKDLELSLTEDIIAAQAFVFYAAGYETSATTLAYLFYELALNPTIQSKLIDEIDDVLNTYNGEITYDTISTMSYLEKVFNETLRKYPLIDLQRRAKLDYKIPGTNITINKGQMVVVSVRGIHNDEKYYPESAKFDPERFEKENSAKRHPCAFLSFGIGPRNCIGMRFAKIQSRVCVVKLLANFRVTVSENTKPIAFDPQRIITSPKNGIMLNLVPRN